MNLSELRDLIRAEADIKGIREYQNLIDSIINQELQRLTGKSKYKELWTQYVFTSPTDGTNNFNVPADYQLIDTLTFSPDPAIQNTFGQRTLVNGIANGYLIRQEGYPFYYTRKGSKFYVYPYTSFFANDTVTLAYYKKPELLLDTDAIPVPSLENVVQQFVMARMLSMKDTRKGQAKRAEAEIAYRDSRTEDAGN